MCNISEPTWEKALKEIERMTEPSDEMESVTVSMPKEMILDIDTISPNRSGYIRDAVAKALRKDIYSR